MKTTRFYQMLRFSMNSLLFLFLVTSCQQNAEKAGEKDMEKTPEQQMGEPVDPDIKDQSREITTVEGTIKLNANIKNWPEDIPSDVPEFKAGRIEGATIKNLKDNKGWTLILKDVPYEALNAYGKELKAKGFETQITAVGEKGGAISAQKGLISVILMGGQGNASLSITVGENQ